MMKRKRHFFGKLIVFLLLAAGINAAFNTVYDHWMIYHRLNRNQDRQFEEFNDTLTYLMLGNSHNMVNPAILGNSFNYASPSEVYPQTYFKFRHILENGKQKPEYVILTVDPVNFSPKADNTLKFDGYWRKYVDYPGLYRETGDTDYLVRWFTGRFCSYAGNYKFIYMSLLFARADFSQIVNGYRPPRDFRNFALEPDRKALGIERANSYLSGYGDRPDPGTVDYFRRILELCREYNVGVIMVRMPFTREYLEQARKLVDLNRLDRGIEQIVAESGVNYRVFDFREEFTDQPSLFFNADHVNPEGADIISRKLKFLLDADN